MGETEASAIYRRHLPALSVMHPLLGSVGPSVSAPGERPIGAYGFRTVVA